MLALASHGSTRLFLKCSFLQTLFWWENVSSPISPGQTILLWHRPHLLHCRNLSLGTTPLESIPTLNRDNSPRLRRYLPPALLPASLTLSMPAPICFASQS